MTGSAVGLFDVETLEPLTRKDAAGLLVEAGGGAMGGRSMADACRNAAPAYEVAPSAAGRQSTLEVLNASAVDMETPPTPSTTEPPDALDALIAKAGLQPREYGEIVHGFLEDHYAGRAMSIGARFDARLGEAARASVEAAAWAMCERWVASPLGRLAEGAVMRKSEFSVLTVGQKDGKRTVMRGTLDLLFEAADGTLYIIDFKSGKNEDAERYAAQLAAYGRAVQDIYHKKARAFLYYLRTGSSVEATPSES
jgi:hypothetical protein